MRDLRTTLAVALRQHESDLVLRRMHADLALRKSAIEQQSRELGHLVDRLRQESIIDPLTGLYNRRHFDIVLRREISLAQREGHPVGIALLDLDHFKVFNDRFGHAAGDIVLHGVATFLRSQLRAHDIASRYGGEEIVLVLPGSSRCATAQLADRLRAGIAALELADQDRPLPSITASFGVAAYPDDGDSSDQLLRDADAAMYRAKANGRDRVEVARSRVLPSH
jgi:diguanylate cyclase (GGDEF)-like protein